MPKKRAFTLVVLCAALSGLKDYPCAYECPTGSGRIVFGKEPNK